MRNIADQNAEKIEYSAGPKAGANMIRTRKPETAAITEDPSTKKTDPVPALRNRANVIFMRFATS
jgi:hypothetical protein